MHAKKKKNRPNNILTRVDVMHLKTLNSWVSLIYKMMEKLVRFRWILIVNNIFIIAIMNIKIEFKIIL